MTNLKKECPLLYEEIKKILVELLDKNDYNKDDFMRYSSAFKEIADKIA